MQDDDSTVLQVDLSKRWSGPIGRDKSASLERPGLLRESAVWWDRNTPEVRAAQRDAEYMYRLAVDPPASKELRSESPKAELPSTRCQWSVVKGAATVAVWSK